MFISIGIPFIVVLSYTIYSKSNIFNNIFSFVILTLIIGLFQKPELCIKINDFIFGFNKIDGWRLIFCSIDFIIVFMTYYILKGSEKYDRKCGILSESFQPIQDAQDLAAIERLRALKSWEKARAYTLLIGFQLFQYFCILLICKMGNVFIEAIVITLSFFLYGRVIQHRWHSASVMVCTLASMGIFYAAAKVSPPFYISWFMPVLIGLCVTIGLWRVAIITENAARYTKSVTKHFKCKTATIEQFTARCLECGFNQEQTAFAIDGLSCNRLSEKLIVDKYNYPLQTVKNKKQYLKKKLEI